MRRLLLALVASGAAASAPATAQCTPVLDELIVSRRGAAGDALGVSVAVDGGVLLAGASGSADVRVFRELGGGWREVQIVRGPEDADFGASLALDGARLAVGAPSENRAGAVHVGRRDDAGRWTIVDRLDTGILGGAFGRAVALDGPRLAVGSPGESRVRIYVDGPSGWTLFQEIAGPPSSGFGRALALEGSRLMVGAPDATGYGPVRGAVFEYVRRARDGRWRPGQVVRPYTSASADPAFGQALALNGYRLAVGAPEHGATRSGAVFVYDRAPGGWLEIARLDPLGGSPGQGLGTAVALEGDVIVAGAPRDSTGGGLAGRAVQYSFASWVWSPVGELPAPTPKAGDRFGTAVAVEAGRAFVGCPLDDPAGVLDAGSVSVVALCP